MTTLCSWIVGFSRARTQRVIPPSRSSSPWSRSPLIAKVLAEIEERLVPLDYNSWHTVDRDLRLRLQRAGHILGSAYVEIDTAGKRIVFSGCFFT